MGVRRIYIWPDSHKQQARPTSAERCWDNSHGGASAAPCLSHILERAWRCQHWYHWYVVNTCHTGRPTCNGLPYFNLFCCCDAQVEPQYVLEDFTGHGHTDRLRQIECQYSIGS